MDEEDSNEEGEEEVEDASWIGWRCGDSSWSVGEVGDA